MLKATEEEIEEVREYFEWQASDLEVTFMQKVYSEAVLNTRHDVWDIRDNIKTAVFIDPANTNNRISDDLTLAEKQALATAASAARRATNWNQIVQ